MAAPSSSAERAVVADPPLRPESGCLGAQLYSIRPMELGSNSSSTDTYLGVVREDLSFDGAVDLAYEPYWRNLEFLQVIKYWAKFGVPYVPPTLTPSDSCQGGSYQMSPHKLCGLELGVQISFLY
ncbi:uncharacterized protein LOC119268088 [Triticum dicoccoides]|uniref:uncharacterized protein LOC119268088 n=1 Tax=Triticum dicoccoides TaxID=85692 RepID=UPI00188E6F77|nr:uncharacterized protein LOC119268088 [Triticum dicoccoides]XP_044340094.1 uncharacterized protein LOC123061196 isoform X1 [Triticum aestivum]XP_044340095.1 uncharacterized protein LOC123061196 isoform X1 [Triticum aestivum]